MNWSLFWSAFGAIGTTIGSLITAIAVVIAVRQYKEPLIKRLKIKFRFAYPMGLGIDTELFCIGVANAGIRPIVISNIYLSVEKKSLVLNSAQFTLPYAIDGLTFPIEVPPEQEVEMYIERARLVGFFTDALSEHRFASNSVVKILVSDKVGDEHYHSTGFTVRNFATNTFE